MQTGTGVFKAQYGARRTTAKPVPGVSHGLFGTNLGVLDAGALCRALPGERDTREGGFRDAMESMALALIAQGVSLSQVNAAAEAVLDGYSNDSDD